MKFSWSIAIASLPCLLLAACTTTTATTTTTPVKNVETSKASPSSVHMAAPDMTTANVGAAQCSLQSVQHIGALAKGGEIAVGFGQRGGLVAWSSPEGIRLKPLSSAGVANGSSMPTSYPKGTKPAAIVAVGRGFAVIAKRIESTMGPCEKTCGDKPCPDVKPGETAPETCEKPTGHEFFVLFTDLDGSNPTAGRPFHTGLVDIETILPGDGQAIGVMTKNEVVWIRKRSDGRLDAERVELPSVSHIVPLSGHGPPGLLLVDKDGSMQLLDERGTNDIKGSFGGSQPKAPATPPKPAAKPPGKPAAPAKPAPVPPAKPGTEVRFHSHWGGKGRIEVSRQMGDSTQFASIEKLVLRVLTDAENQGTRESFANSVEVRQESGRLQRIGWDKRPVGGDIDVRTVDTAADTSRMHVAWSGSAFVFAHPSNPPHQAEAQAVGIVAAICGSGKP